MTNNVNSPFGYSPVRTLTGENLGQPILCFVPASDATALYVGDAVTLAAGTADTNAYGVPAITQAGTSSVLFGIIVGVDPILTGATPNLYISYRPASTAAYIYVQPLLPNIVFKVQGTATSAYADVGSMAPIVVGGGGSTTNGLSGMSLGTPSTATASDADAFFIIGANRTPGNVIGNGYCVYDVVANISMFTGGATGV